MGISRKYLHQVLACLPAVLVEFLTGIGWGWTAPTLLKLQSSDSVMKITPTQLTWLGSTGEVGRMFSTLLSALFLDNFGRKNTLIFGSAVYVFVWSAVIYTRNVHVLIATRILFGVANGLNDVTSTIYPAETCSPNLRGIVIGGVILAVLAGMTLEFFLTTYLSYTNAAIVNTILAIGALSSQYFGVETTYFLTMIGKHEQAKKNFVWLQGGHCDVEEEMRKIRKNVEEEKRKKKTLRALFTSATNLKTLSTATGFGLILATVGFQTVVVYASMIFVGSEKFSANEYTIMFGAAKFLGTAVFLFFVERVNRRPLMIVSLIIVAGCTICTSALMYLHSRNYDVVLYPWMLFSCIALYGFISSLMMITACTITNEILPLSVRAIGASLTTTAQSLGAFFTTLLFWPVTERFGMEANFLIYTVMSLLTLVFVYIVIPETRGKALHEMYEKSSQVEHAQK